MRIHQHIHAHICMFIVQYIYTHRYIYIYIYIYTHARPTCVYIYRYIHIRPYYPEPSFPPGGGLVLGDNSGYAGLTNFVAAAGDVVMVVCRLASISSQGLGLKSKSVTVMWLWLLLGKAKRWILGQCLDRDQGAER